VEEGLLISVDNASILILHGLPTPLSCHFFLAKITKW